MICPGSGATCVELVYQPGAQRHGIVVFGVPCRVQKRQRLTCGGIKQGVDRIGVGVQLLMITTLEFFLALWIVPDPFA